MERKERKVKKIKYYALIQDADNNKYFISPASEDGIITLYTYDVYLGYYNGIFFNDFKTVPAEKIEENFQFVFPEVNRPVAVDGIEERNRSMIKEYFLKGNVTIVSLVKKYNTTVAGDIIKRNSDRCEQYIVDEYIRKNTSIKNYDEMSEDEKTSMLFKKIQTRAKNALIRNGYDNITRIHRAIVDDEFIGMKNIGVATIRSIVDVLRTMNYSVPDKYFIDSYHGATSMNSDSRIPYIKPYAPIYIDKLENDPEYSIMIRFSTLSSIGGTHKGVGLVSRNTNHVSIYWITDPKYDIDILNKMRSGIVKYLKNEGWI